MNKEDIKNRISELRADLKKAEDIFLQSQDQLNPKVTIEYEKIDELKDADSYPFDYQLFVQFIGKLTLGTGYLHLELGPPENKNINPGDLFDYVEDFIDEETAKRFWVVGYDVELIPFGFDSKTEPFTFVYCPDSNGSAYEYDNFLDYIEQKISQFLEIIYRNYN